MAQFRSPVLLLDREEEQQPQPQAGGNHNGGQRPITTFAGDGDYDPEAVTPEALAKISLAIAHTIQNRRVLRRVKEVE
jgi:hypothetical protein